MSSLLYPGGLGARGSGLRVVSRGSRCSSLLKPSMQPVCVRTEFKDLLSSMFLTYEQKPTGINYPY